MYAGKHHGLTPLTRFTIPLLLSLALLAAGPSHGAEEAAHKLVVPDGKAYQGKKITAKTYNSGFALGHDSYNAMGTGSDGKIYYVLSSDNIDQGAKMFCFDPKTQQIKELGDLTEACGEKGSKAIPQGKSHVNFVEANGKLYFATHVGVYSIVEGKETMGIPPAGYKPYPGGHLLSYDLKTGKFEDFGICPGREGVLVFNMDTKRGRMFGLTWPSGIFYRYDLATEGPEELWQDVRPRRRRGRPRLPHRLPLHRRGPERLARPISPAPKAPSSAMTPPPIPSRPSRAKT